MHILYSFLHVSQLFHHKENVNETILQHRFNFLFITSTKLLMQKNYQSTFFRKAKSNVV
jgi:hypothetical protein